MDLPQLQSEQLSLLEMLEDSREFFPSPNTPSNGNQVIHQDVDLNSTWLNVPTTFEGYGGVGGDNIVPDQGDMFSDTESLTSCGSAVASPAVFGHTEHEEHFVFPLKDDELKHLSVKELNLKLKGQPKGLVKLIKKRRRTLKNRGYAHSCRIKRLQEKSSLQTTKSELETMIADLQQQLTATQNEKDIYKTRYEALVRRIVMANSPNSA